ncbi:DNA glycosylase AlkZ-like family protein [Puniceicoccus vermicola]|uniref:YcaQ family DNA glycosylase n=1 Tax=Puniceicoccus vermicola TaxID=388746 RepID=A0A7X1AUL8_9BACT|nr:crosslink repair DNA glycosylase YcaQ family protein [Puniceicoccus vermicola]MBC2600311.1 YcaQ family DNA glycosylase [Puniceicoccus vermicola]
MSPRKIQLKEFRRRVVAGSFPQYPNLAAGLRGLRFVQADPIRSPARAQDLILRHRVNSYASGDLEKEYPHLGAEEGYLFAYGFMQPDVWQDLHSQPAVKLTALERQVLAFIQRHGEVHPRDLADHFGKRSVTNYWGGKSQATKRVLEDLHEEGYLRVSRREKGIRLYEVAENAHQKLGDPEARFARLTMTTAHVFGPATKSFMLSELRGFTNLVPKRKDREAIVDELVASGQLRKIDVDGLTYLLENDKWKSNEVTEKVRILAPFDPLVRSRQRFEQLWGWSYRFEAYVPTSKRVRGYYAMPLLWRENVTGWANAKVLDERLHVEVGYVRKPTSPLKFRCALETEIEAMTLFLGLVSGAWSLNFSSD